MSNKITGYEKQYYIDNYLEKSYKELAKDLNCNINRIETIAKYCSSRKKVNKNTKIQKYVICAKCKIEYPKTNEYFYINKNGSVTGCKCKNCHKISNIESSGANIRNFISYILIRTKNGRRVKSGRLDYNLSIDGILSLYSKQNGKCAITGIELTHNRTKKLFTNLSIDRVDSTKGYIEDNIQLVCLWANLAKSELTIDEFNNFIKLTYNYKNAKN